MASLNIAEKRLPQDGRFRIRTAGKDVDLRVSVLPTSHGERVVLRLLEKENRLLDLSEMGFSQERLGIIQQLIQLSHGIILVTGPTGSGKTTTLYAALTHINSPDKNIITVEDPVEYQLLGVGQMQVNPKINLTFAAGLRSILRQDPDVIMIGEIRDRETAEIAINASLTGTFGFLHAPYQRCLECCHAIDRHGHRTVSRRLLGGGRLSSTVAPPGLSGLQAALSAD